MKLNETSLDKRILEICEKHNITDATEIQEKSIPHILNGHSILGVSETGSGKTLSFLLPTIHKLLKADRSFFALVIAPTRELAQQISRNIMIFESLGIRCCTLVGGDKVEKQYPELAKHPHFVVGTPGRISLAIKKSNKLKIKNFRVLIVDEVDKCFSTDLVEEINAVVGCMRPKRQNLFFSATMSDSVVEFTRKFYKNFKIVETSLSIKKLETLDEYYYLVPRKYKEIFMFCLFKEKKDTKFMVFVKMISTARLLSCIFKNLGIANEALHGNLEQQTRDDILDGFRMNTYQVLFTTDVGSRGLDFVDIGCVINFDIPLNDQDYVHRVGRTARAGRNGTAITLVTQYDVPSYQSLEFKLQRKFPLFTFEYMPENYVEEFESARGIASKEVKNLAEKERPHRFKAKK